MAKLPIRIVKYAAIQICLNLLTVASVAVILRYDPSMVIDRSDFPIWLILVVPFIEELFFRKLLLFNLVKKFKRPLFFNVVVSLVFSASHYTGGTNAHFSAVICLFAYLSSILYGHIMLKEKDVRITMLIHFLNNLFTLLLYYLGEFINV